jgi:hypothetical protein
MEKDDRQSGNARETTGGREAQRAQRPAPGKVTRTSRLEASRGPAVQRKSGEPRVPSGPGAARDRAGSHELYMDAAHRGLTALAERGQTFDEVAAASGGGNPMPAAVQAKMENAFGADFSAVRVHQGPQAASIGALAYTQGADVHFAPGQYDPGSQRGQELLGHELAHVVQQSQGRVQATAQAKGLPLNDDASLEREADAMGAKAARGEPVDGAPPGEVAGSPALRVRQRLVARQPAQRAIQRAPVPTWAGEFKTDKYEMVTDPGLNGVDMVLRFTPKDPANAKKIGLTQSVRSRDSGGPVIVGDSATLKSRTIPEGQDGAGTRIDRVSTHGNPLYAADRPSAGQALGDTPTVAGWGKHGWHYRDTGGKLETEHALLKDTPTLRASRTGSSQVFESAALAVEGEQAGTYYGSVQWGWQKDAAGKVTKLPLTPVSSDAPSSVFAAATTLWNQGKTSEGADTLDLPIVAAKYTNAEAEMVRDPAKQKETALHKLAKNTRVEVTGTNATWSKVTVVAGTYVGSVGWVMSSTLSENQSK